MLLEKVTHKWISIHAPREGSDTVVSTAEDVAGLISIHAPREGSDSCSQGLSGQRQDFYPRSPRGERRTRPPYPCGASHISIHAPREGSDME